MWLENNKQLKNVLPLYSVLSVLLNYFIYNRFSIVEQLQLRLEKIGSKRFLFFWLEKVSSLSSYLHSSKKSQDESCLPNWFTINIPNVYWRNTLAYNICHRVDIYRLLWDVWIHLLVNTSSKFSNIIDYYEFPTFLID